VSIPATYAFLRVHGVDSLVDGYGVHDYPPVVKPGHKAALAKRNAQLDEQKCAATDAPDAEHCGYGDLY
jgi:hypothetical protein